MAIQDEYDIFRTPLPMKRRLFIQELIPGPDRERIRFPGGVVCGLVAQQISQLVNRVQLLGTGKDWLGVMKQVYVAYTSHPTILEVARRSNYVVEARSIAWSRRHTGENYKQGLLVIKQFDQHPAQTDTKIFTPNEWMENLSLDTGDKIIVSNPLEDYVMAMPEGAAPHYENSQQQP